MNPAEELASLFSSWVPSGQTPADARAKPVEGDEIAMWRSVARGATLLDEIEDALAALRAADRSTVGFDRYVLEWQRAVFSADLPWRQATNAQAISPEAYAALHGLALVLDLDLDAAPPIDSARSIALLALLDEAEAALGAEGERLSDDEREYLWRLISAAREFLGEKRGRRGKVDLREHVDRLSGALVSVSARLAESGDRAAAERFFGLGMRFAAGRTVLYDAAAVATLLSSTLDGARAIAGG